MPAEGLTGVPPCASIFVYGIGGSQHGRKAKASSGFSADSGGVSGAGAPLGADGAARSHPGRVGRHFCAELYDQLCVRKCSAVLYDFRRVAAEQRGVGQRALRQAVSPVSAADLSGELVYIRLSLLSQLYRRGFLPWFFRRNHGRNPLVSVCLSWPAGLPAFPAPGSPGHDPYGSRCSCVHALCVLFASAGTQLYYELQGIPGSSRFQRIFGSLCGG